ncbi:MAG: class F420-dependent oxidoreductase [Ilumatobacteraceae bacterium]|nr:class F420-dependent oxidoreductase [Ilumatobacteraceae bacterium]
MRIAIQTPPEHTSFAALRDVWTAADALGFHAAYTFDHLVPLNPGQRPGTPGGVPDGPQFEGWTALSALAAGTTRLQVGTLVTGVTYRHPALLAKMAVTLDHVTDGRAVLGLGAAWHEAEHRMYGIEYPGVGERMGRLDESLTIFRRLCTEDAVDFAGRYYQLEQAVFDPKPVRPSGIPILVGGSGDRLKRIAARHATMFNSFAAPWEWPAVNIDLDEKLRAAGRAAHELERTAFVFSELSGSSAAEDELVGHFQRTRGGTDEEVRSRIVIGSPDAMVAVLRSYADAGVSTVILNLRPPFDVAGLERFATEVLPALG